MLTVWLGLPIGRITFFAFRRRATFHTAWTHSGRLPVGKRIVGVAQVFGKLPRRDVVWPRGDA
jgi:hypothetical protein